MDPGMPDHDWDERCDDFDCWYCRARKAEAEVRLLQRLVTRLSGGRVSVG